MELGPLIAACKEKKIITERTADLSSVIRSYRNLIHPGRVVRLRERVDKKSASIAKALLDVVADEIAAAKEATYGFTADQIANKIEKDASAISVLPHFLKETNERERERLVMEVLPDRHRTWSGDDEWMIMNFDDYRTCYRRTLETLPPEGKSKVAKRFIKILKEESGDYIEKYENAFFKASDLDSLHGDDAALAKEHIISRLEKDQGPGMLEVVEGLGFYLIESEVGRVFDAYAKAISFGRHATTKNRARELLSLLYYEAQDDKLKERIVKRADKWIAFWEERSMDEPKAALEKVKAEWEIEVPF
jgi:hypothetical protein